MMKYLIILILSIGIAQADLNQGTPLLSAAPNPVTAASVQ